MRGEALRMNGAPAPAFVNGGSGLAGGHAGEEFLRALLAVAEGVGESVLGGQLVGERVQAAKGKLIRHFVANEGAGLVGLWMRLSRDRVAVTPGAEGAA